MWIIDWLLARFEDLAYLFDVIWSKVKQLGDLGWDFIWGWIIYWKEWLLGKINDLTDWTRTEFDNVRDFFRGLLAEAEAALQASINAVNDWVLTEINNLINWINQATRDIWDALNQTAQDIRDTVTGWINDVYTWAAGIVNDAINYLSGVIDGVRSGLTDLVNAINDALNQAINDVASIFNQFRQTWEGLLHTLFDNPAAFIFALIEAWVYPWAEWFIASLLGGVNIPTPARPPLWGPGGGGGGGEGGGGGSSGQLIFPSDYHTLSGYNYGAGHWGVDFGTPYGVPVWAADGGVVSHVEWLQTGYGYHVDIDHGNGWLTRYAHLAAIYVQPSQNVSQRQTLGIAGSTGNSSGPHLHFETYFNGGPVNPLSVLH